jgi:hypothetical protein
MTRMTPTTRTEATRGQRFERPDLRRRAFSFEIGGAEPGSDDNLCSLEKLGEVLGLKDGTSADQAVYFPFEQEQL